MIISSNWLKEFTGIDIPIEDLATLIGARLVEIEEVIDYGAKYKDVVVAKVVSCQKLENSDHLNVAKIDDGGRVLDVERDEDGYVQVVCGAPNVREGISIAWLPPKSVVPDTFGDDEPFVLGSRKLRGVMSNGMIASARELALFDEHEGILEVDVEGIVPGTPFAQAYGLNDYLLDIENKSLTHRPDAFGVAGFAREVAAIQGNAFTTPLWLRNDALDFGEKQQSDIENPTVSIDSLELSARYQGVVLTNIDGSVKSPLSLQTFLARVGIRPISAVVDVTNYLMLATGQPLHAFDYDKLAEVNGGKINIHVRGGRPGEKLELLDGRTVELAESDIVIANGETAVALAGAMGGAATEIDDTTKTVFLESATFNLYSLRATQMRHGIFSEAITRFTKGQPAELTAPVLARAVSLLAKYVNATRVSDVVEAYPGRQDTIAVSLNVTKINNVLGTDFGIDEIATIMRNVEFGVTVEGTELTFVVPYWRADIHIKEDIIEEVGRLSGFDAIAPVLPKRDFTAVRPSSFDKMRSEVRRALVRAGANEVLTYSFVHGNILAIVNQKTEDSYRITNSISPDLQYYRQTLTPSLLGAVHGNVKQGYDSFALFEVNKTHPKQHGLTDENVPVEVAAIALTVASKKPQVGAPFYQAKKMLQYLGESLGLDLLFSPIDADPNYSATAPFEYRRSALVTDRKTDTYLGVVGEYKRSVSKGFKLPEYSAGFEISTTAAFEAVQKLGTSYAPLSRYPSLERDICFKVGGDVRYQQVIDAINAALDQTNLDTAVSPVDIYQREAELTKNITVRLRLTARDRTLTGDEASGIIDRVVDSVVKATDATVI